MKSSQKTKLISFVAAGLFVLTGTYNSVVINSESSIKGSEVKFVKRLDEIYGVTVAGREVAASVSWQKLKASEKVITKVPPKIYDSVKTTASAASIVSSEPEQVVPAAAVQEELSLSLVEVINPKKWQQGLPNTQFSGSLTTNNGVIEDLSVSLPNGESVSVSFSEMAGNVFEYDMNGELYSGMMYQVDQASYMVTLSNGPLEGTRLRFASEAPIMEQSQPQEALAENNYRPENYQQDYQSYQADPNMEQAQAQEATIEEMNQADLQMQQQALQAQGQYLDHQTM
jgi:hypothetical protein